MNRKVSAHEWFLAQIKAGIESVKAGGYNAAVHDGGAVKKLLDGILAIQLMPEDTRKTVDGLREIREAFSIGDAPQNIKGLRQVVRDWLDAGISELEAEL
ncbi:MAG: hypothetical protein NTY61_01655 [Candidatus Parcubacteria bacterium]|nr:hypothetical protein [Candidatus Parcubacteria bacterium]